MHLAIGVSRTTAFCPADVKEGVTLDISKVDCIDCLYSAGRTSESRIKDIYVQLGRIAERNK